MTEPRPPSPGDLGAVPPELDRLGSERERYEDALHVRYGGSGSGSMSRLVYALYLVAIFAGLYGFTLVRGSLDWIAPNRVATIAGSPWTAALVAAAGALAAGVAWWAGRVRGPVAPELPEVDVIVAGPLDRALVLQGRLRLWLTGLAMGGLILGAVTGAGALSTGAGGPPLLVAGAVIGLVLGGIVGGAWFAGQVADSRGGRPRPGRPGWSLAAGLRSLGLDPLRRHSIRSTHLGGAALSGDLRAARLDVSRPVTRGRSLRLRAAGPARTIVRRDLLGLRRSPALPLTGAVLTAGGLAGALTVLADARIPTALAMLALALAHLGFGAWSEGVRLVGDNAGTPPLLGMRFRAEAAAHLVVPVTAYLIVGGLTGAVVAAATELALPAAAAVVVLIGGQLAGATLLAAFRGAPPDTAFLPEYGPVAMTYWYARPLVVAAVSGGLPIGRLAEVLAGNPAAMPGGEPVIYAVWALSVAALLYWGLRQARSVELAHRI